MSLLFHYFTFSMITINITIASSSAAVAAPPPSSSSSSSSSYSSSSSSSPPPPSPSNHCHHHYHHHHNLSSIFPLVLPLPSLLFISPPCFNSCLNPLQPLTHQTAIHFFRHRIAPGYPRPLEESSPVPAGRPEG